MPCWIYDFKCRCHWWTPIFNNIIWPPLKFSSLKLPRWDRTQGTECHFLWFVKRLLAHARYRWWRSAKIVWGWYVKQPCILSSTKSQIKFCFIEKGPATYHALTAIWQVLLSNFSRSTRQPTVALCSISNMDVGLKRNFMCYWMFNTVR